jgi:5'(3')-deoxyribonucleotidase
MICYIDMDGVTVDFYAGFSKLHGTPKDWKPGVYDLNKVYSKPNLFQHCDAFWWENLPKTSECDALMEATQSFEQVFLTHAIDERSFKGKNHWVRRYYPKLPIVFAENKRVVHGLLIDDNPHFATRHETITMPRYWNHLHEIRHDALKYVKDELTWRG